MSVIAAAYSYTALSISQTSTAAADAGTKSSTARVFSQASSSAPDASVTTVSISYRAKLLLARASSEQSVVDQLQAQLDAFGTGGSAAGLRGTNDGLSVGMDLFEIISGAGDDSIRVQASNATIDAGAGNDVIDVEGQANIVAGEGDDFVRTYGHSTVTGGAGDDYIKVAGNNSTINFAKGDGNDVVRIDNGSDSVDLSISGYSQDDVIVTQRYGRTTINFKGSNDSLAFDHGRNGSVRLSFADHTSVDIHA